MADPRRVLISVQTSSTSTPGEQTSRGNSQYASSLTPIEQLDQPHKLRSEIASSDTPAQRATDEGTTRSYNHDGADTIKQYDENKGMDSTEREHKPRDHDDNSVSDDQEEDMSSPTGDEAIHNAPVPMPIIDSPFLDGPVKPKRNSRGSSGNSAARIELETGARNPSHLTNSNPRKRVHEDYDPHEAESHPYDSFSPFSQLSQPNTDQYLPYSAPAAASARVPSASGSIGSNNRILPTTRQTKSAGISKNSSSSSHRAAQKLSERIYGPENMGIQGDTWGKATSDANHAVEDPRQLAQPYMKHMASTVMKIHGGTTEKRLRRHKNSSEKWDTHHDLLALQSTNTETINRLDQNGSIIDRGISTQIGEPPMRHTGETWKRAARDAYDRPPRSLYSSSHAVRPNLDPHVPVPPPFADDHNIAATAASRMVTPETMMHSQDEELGSKNSQNSLEPIYSRNDRAPMHSNDYAGPEWQFKYGNEGSARRRPPPALRVAGNSPELGGPSLAFQGYVHPIYQTMPMQPAIELAHQQPMRGHNEQMQAILEIQGNLHDMTLNWTAEEKNNGRRLVKFERIQQGVVIYLHFEPISAKDYHEDMCVISCIWRKETAEYFITSVNCIALLELIINQKFSVEEKNRIRRNLEVCKPLTVSKSKPGLEPFFRQIMGFTQPRPRNIEKDVKVFLWSNLENALNKIISKYSASWTVMNH